ncbi:MAG TPA: phosphoribosyltransferase family protein [Chitinophagaceae bacterium]|jgi:predicted phosphoribosyltransferase|nr:phosphoribosyltransferase family protein [Chitinophagaceae bacterium]
MFFDRIHAGELLAAELKKYKNDPGVVLAVPRGGVPIAYMVAKKLDWPLDLLLTKKIGHPLNGEYAIGSVSLTDRLITPHEGVSQTYIDRETEKIRLRLREMYKKFMGDKEPVSIKNKTVIVIDDGMATGNTLMSTINMLRQGGPDKIIVAVPVASSSAYQKISNVVDEIICLLVPEYFAGVGAFYENFEQVTDDEVLYYLDKMKALKKIS